MRQIQALILCQQSRGNPGKSHTEEKKGVEHVCKKILQGWGHGTMHGVLAYAWSPQLHP